METALLKAIVVDMYAVMWKRMNNASQLLVEARTVVKSIEGVEGKGSYQVSSLHVINMELAVQAAKEDLLTLHHGARGLVEMFTPEQEAFQKWYKAGAHVVGKEGDVHTSGKGAEVEKERPPLKKAKKGNKMMKEVPTTQVPGVPKVLPLVRGCGGGGGSPPRIEQEKGMNVGRGWGGLFVESAPIVVKIEPGVEGGRR